MVHGKERSVVLRLYTTFWKRWSAGQDSVLTKGSVDRAVLPVMMKGFLLAQEMLGALIVIGLLLDYGTGVDDQFGRTVLAITACAFSVRVLAYMLVKAMST